MKPNAIAAVFFMLSASGGINAQTTPITNFDRGLLIGNLLVEGYKALSGDGSKKADPNAKTVESFCFKNKMDEKITVKLNAEIEDEPVKKEFVIQKGDKECTYDLPKGIYVYEIALSSKDIYQKGEYQVTEKTQFTVNK